MFCFIYADFSFTKQLRSKVKVIPNKKSNFSLLRQLSIRLSGLSLIFYYLQGFAILRSVKKLI